MSAWFKSLYPNHTSVAWSSSGVIDAIADFTAFDKDILYATSDTDAVCTGRIQWI